MNNAHRVGTMLAVLVEFGAHAAHGATIYNGKPVQFQYYAYGGVYGDPTTFTAPGHTIFKPYFDVAVVGHQIIYTYLQDTTWSSSILSLHTHRLYVHNGAVIYSVGGESKIRNVELDPASILVGSTFSASNITFDVRGVAVDWTGISFTAGDKVILDVTRSVPMSPGPPKARIAPAARSAPATIPPPTAESTPPRR